MRFRDIMRRLDGAGLRHTAKALLRLLDGGAAAAPRAFTGGDAAATPRKPPWDPDNSDAAAVTAEATAENPRRAADNAAAADALPRVSDGGGEAAAGLRQIFTGGGAAEAPRAFTGDGAATAETPRTFAGGDPEAFHRRAARSDPEARENNAAYGAAGAAPSRAGRRTDTPEGEAEALSPAAKPRRDGRETEDAARRRETDAPAFARNLRRIAEADVSAQEQERQRLGAALEALSSGRLRALSPAPEGVGETWIADAARAADGGGARGSAPPAGYAGTRAGPAGNGAAARSFPGGSFPSSGAYSGGDPEAVSEFFRRDSRRYDATFGGV